MKWPASLLVNKPYTSFALDLYNSYFWAFKAWNSFIIYYLYIKSNSNCTSSDISFSGFPAVFELFPSKSSLDDPCLTYQTAASVTSSSSFYYIRISQTTYSISPDWWPDSWLTSIYRKADCPPSLIAALQVIKPRKRISDVASAISFHQLMWCIIIIIVSGVVFIVGPLPGSPKGWGEGLGGDL